MIGTDRLAKFDTEQCCYLTTVGRRTGEPHEIEIWFTTQAGSLYLISGGGLSADWVKNLAAHPDATIRVGTVVFHVRARLAVTDPDVRLAVAQGLAAKYSGDFDEPSAWVDSACLIALDPVPPDAAGADL